MRHYVRGLEMSNENTPGVDEQKWKQRFLFLVNECWFKEQADWYLGLPETEHSGEFEDAMIKKIDLRIRVRGG